MKFILSALLVSFSVYSTELCYHNLIEQFPETFGRKGCWKQGEIEIATLPDEIKRIEKLSVQRFMRMGYSEEIAKSYSKCGIIAEDHYWMWIRDAVTFPGGIPGTYDRIVWKSGLTGTPGAVIFPVLQNHKVLVNVNFRHATRAWELEIPRGARKQKESGKEAATRELREETGCIASEMIFLGDLAPETGVITGTIPVYFASVENRKARHQDESEAIALNIEMSVEEIEQAFIKGYALIKIRDQLTKVYCRDPFLSYALLQSKLRKLI